MAWQQLQQLALHKKCVFSGGNSVNSSQERDLVLEISISLIKLNFSNFTMYAFTDVDFIFCPKTFIFRPKDSFSIPNPVNKICISLVWFPIQRVDFIFHPKYSFSVPTPRNIFQIPLNCFTLTEADLIFSYKTLICCP